MIARKNHIGLYYQEKDYLQTSFLFAIYRITDELIFKGGTCLKIAYGYQRFSEDLDFNSALSPSTLEKIVKKSLKETELMGMEHSFDKEELFEGAYTSKIRFAGPRFTGSRESTNTIRIDAGMRGGTVQKPRWIQIATPYPDISSFFLLAMTGEEILAEKIRALSMRSEARDLFDIWCLIQDGVKTDRGLIKKKSVEINFGELRFPTREEYERDLKNLLPATIPYYEQIVEDVIKALRI